MTSLRSPGWASNPYLSSLVLRGGIEPPQTQGFNLVLYRLSYHSIKVFGTTGWSPQEISPATTSPCLPWKLHATLVINRNAMNHIGDPRGNRTRPTKDENLVSYPIDDGAILKNALRTSTAPVHPAVHAGGDSFRVCCQTHSFPLTTVGLQGPPIPQSYACVSVHGYWHPENGSPLQI